MVRDSPDGQRLRWNPQKVVERRTRSPIMANVAHVLPATCAIGLSGWTLVDTGVHTCTAI